MEDVRLADYGLESVGRELSALRVDCLSGKMNAAWQDSASWLGGLPCVDADFVWPTNAGRPLSFVAQLSARELGLAHDGALLFFHDKECTGFKKADAMGFRLLRQRAVRQLGTADVPTGNARRFLGFRSRSVPTVWRRIGLKFQTAFSYPSLGEAETEVLRVLRDAEAGTDLDLQQAYVDLCQSVNPPVQVRGVASPCNADEAFVREHCGAQLGVAPLECELLFALQSVNDMVWGDSGSLCWYARRDDFVRASFESTWAVMTS